MALKGSTNTKSQDIYTALRASVTASAASLSTQQQQQQQQQSSDFSLEPRQMNLENKSLLKTVCALHTPSDVF